MWIMWIRDKKIWSIVKLARSVVGLAIHVYMFEDIFIKFIVRVVNLFIRAREETEKRKPIHSGARGKEKRARARGEEKREIGLINGSTANAK